MNHRLTCSVTLMTYNGEKYIIDQLQSIENQTIQPDELIVGDDCSTDNTVTLINQFIEKSKLNIVFYQNKTNLGIRDNEKKVRSFCKCDIVLSADQDDVWHEKKIETILNQFNKENVVFVFSDGYVTDENLNIIKDTEWLIDWTKFNTQQYFDYCQTRNFPLGHLQAMKKDVLKRIEPFLSDGDGWKAQCAPAFGEVVAIPEKLVYYRRHSNAVSDAFIESRRNSHFAIIKKMWKTSYQEYFTWPEAELITYSKIYEYVEDNGFKVKPDRLLEHLDYLKRLKEVESKHFFARKKALKGLFNSGIYQQYRGNKNTYFLDTVFMLINSITGK